MRVVEVSPGVFESVQADICLVLHVDDYLCSSSVPTLEMNGLERPGGMAEEILEPMLQPEGYVLKSEIVIRDGKSVSYFVGLEIRQSADGFHVYVGVEGFVETLVRSVMGEDMEDEEWDALTEQWSKQRDLKVPMKPGLLLVPTEEGEKVYTKDEWPYRRVIGGTLWSLVVRLDVSQTVRQLSRFCLKPGEQHVECSKHMLKYLYLNKELCLHYSAEPGENNLNIPGKDEKTLLNDLSQFTSSLYGGKVYKVAEGKFVDAAQYQALKTAGVLEDGKMRLDDEGNVIDVDVSYLLFQDASFQTTFDFKSVSGYVDMMAHCAVNGGSHTQAVIATSTMESEVLATHRATQQLIHMKTLLEELGVITVMTETPSFEDNKSAKIILETPGRRKGAKHFERSLNKCHEFSLNGHVKYIYCPTKEMLADFFTKALDIVTFLKFRKVIFNEPRGGFKK